MVLDVTRRCRRYLFLAAAAPLVLPLSGCASGPDGPALDAETYIGVMVELRRAHDANPSAAAFQAERTRILQEAGVTDSVLVQWVRGGGHDPEFLAALWDTINARLTAVEDSAG